MISFKSVDVIIHLTLFIFTDGTGKDLYSPEAESSPAPSFVEPTVVTQLQGPSTKPTSRTSSFEIENLLKTAEQVSKLDMTIKKNTWPMPRGTGEDKEKAIQSLRPQHVHTNHYHHHYHPHPHAHQHQQRMQQCRPFACMVIALLHMQMVYLALHLSYVLHHLITV